MNFDYIEILEEHYQLFYLWSYALNSSIQMMNKKA